MVRSDLGVVACIVVVLVVGYNWNGGGVFRISVGTVVWDVAMAAKSEVSCEIDSIAISVVVSDSIS